MKLSHNVPNPTISDEQLVRAHAGLSELLLDREETLRRGEYIEALVEQAHKDALQERASIISGAAAGASRYQGDARGS